MGVDAGNLARYLAGYGRDIGEGIYARFKLRQMNQKPCLNWQHPAMGICFCAVTTEPHPFLSWATAAGERHCLCQADLGHWDLG